MEYKSYPKYKNATVAWVSYLPEHWDAMRAKFLFGRKQRPVRDADEIVTAFRNGVVTLRKNRREDGFTVALKEIGYQGVRKGDLVIHAMDAFAGAVGVSDSNGKCSPVYSCCEPHNNVNAKYYGYLVRTMSTTGFIESLAKGIRERSTDFRWNDFGALYLPLPPKDEQGSVVTFLDRETTRIDALIEKKQRLIELLKEKRQAVITQAVTKGLDPNVPMKDSGVEWLGEVPEHWCVMQIGYLLDRIEQGKSPQCESRPVEGDEWGVLKTGCVNGGKYGAHENKAMPQNEVPHSQYEVKVGDVLMSRASGSIDLIGSAALVAKTPPRILLSDKIFRLKYNEKVSPEYLVLVLGSRPSRQQIELSINGAEGLANNITKPSIMAIRIGVPPIHEQSQIVQEAHRQVMRIDQVQEKTEKSVSLLKEHRSALITAAVTGQIDVRNVA